METYCVMNGELWVPGKVDLVTFISAPQDLAQDLSHDSYSITYVLN